MRIKIGCDFLYESEFSTPMMMLVRPSTWHGHRIVEEFRQFEPSIPVREYVDRFGNFVWRFTVPSGSLRIIYDALAEVPPTADPVFPRLAKMPVDQLPDEVMIYTLPSRHCQSDLFINDAWALFGGIQTGWEQVQAVCDWLHTNIEYSVGSNSSTSGYEAYQARRGVCRDFAHLGVSFCRALNIPARYVCGYLPDINVPFTPTPMDFHAWFEAYLDGDWRVFDPRHNEPRIGRVRIGVGRDAVDLALATIYGAAELTRMNVWADEVDERTSVLRGNSS
jgi:transglutaminase-like putative cysteine protease